MAAYLSAAYIEEQQGCDFVLLMPPGQPDEISLMGWENV
jgi:hypothetical protein